MNALLYVAFHWELFSVLVKTADNVAELVYPVWVGF
jgi:hypothetical protein